MLLFIFCLVLIKMRARQASFHFWYTEESHDEEFRVLWSTVAGCQLIVYHGEILKQWDTHSKLHIARFLFDLFLTHSRSGWRQEFTSSTWRDFHSLTMMVSKWTYSVKWSPNHRPELVFPNKTKNFGGYTEESVHNPALITSLPLITPSTLEFTCSDVVTRELHGGFL